MYINLPSTLFNWRYFDAVHLMKQSHNTLINVTWRHSITGTKYISQTMDMYRFQKLHATYPFNERKSYFVTACITTDMFLKDTSSWLDLDPRYVCQKFCGCTNQYTVVVSEVKIGRGRWYNGKMTPKTRPKYIVQYIVFSKMNSASSDETDLTFYVAQGQATSFTHLHQATSLLALWSKTWILGRLYDLLQPTDSVSPHWQTHWLARRCLYLHSNLTDFFQWGLSQSIRGFGNECPVQDFKCECENVPFFVHYNLTRKFCSHF